jgi:TRAP-type C4-dicarboxylate transport system permease small subunit
MEDSVQLKNFFAVGLVKAINIIVVILNSAVAGAMFWMVVSRHFLPSSPMLWIEEMIILLALWLYFIGGASCSFSDGHVKGGFLDIWLNEKKQQLTRRLAGFCELGILTAYIWLATKYFIHLFNSNKSAIYLNLNKSYWALSVVVGLTLMSFFVVFHIISSFNHSKNDEAEEPSHDNHTI